MSSDAEAKGLVWQLTPTRFSPGLRLVALLVVCLAVRLATLPIMLNDKDREDFVRNAYKTVKLGVAQYYEPVENFGGYEGIPSPYPPLQIYFQAIVDENGKAIFQLLKIMRGANPVVTAQAHNLWWLVLHPFGVNPMFVHDDSLAVLGLNYIAISLIIVGIFYLAASYKLLKDQETISPEILAYIGLVFFMLGVRAHGITLFRSCHYCC